MGARTHPFGQRLDSRCICSPPEVLAAAHTYTPPFGQQGFDLAEEQDTVPEAVAVQTHTPPFGQQGLDLAEEQDTVPEAGVEAPEPDHKEQDVVRSEALHGRHIRPSQRLPINSVTFSSAI